MGERFFAKALRLPKGDEKWCAIFPAGEQWHPGAGVMNIDRAYAEAFIASWRAAGSPALVVTLHHPKPDEEMTAEEREVAKAAWGWIEDMRLGDGAEVALEGAIKWTSKAKTSIDADEYRFLSPEWWPTHIDRRSGAERNAPWLFGAALLNDPHFHTMPRVAASKQTTPTHTPNAASAEEQHTMKSIALALRLPENATEEQIAETAKKLMATHVENVEKLTAAVSATTKLTALQESLEALKASNAATQAELAKAKAEKHEADVKQLVSTAKRAGKPMTEKLVAAVTKLAAAQGIAAAEELVAELPVAVAVGKEKGHGEGGEPTTDDAKAEYHRLMAEMEAKGVAPHQAINLMKRNHPAIFAAAMRAPKPERD